MKVSEIEVPVIRELVCLLLFIPVSFLLTLLIITDSLLMMVEGLLVEFQLFFRNFKRIWEGYK